MAYLATARKEETRTCEEELQKDVEGGLDPHITNNPLEDECGSSVQQEFLQIDVGVGLELQTITTKMVSVRKMMVDSCVILC